MYNGRIFLNNYSKGSYGNIFKDGESNIYKVTKISEDGVFTASNINEIIAFNFLKIIKKMCSDELTDNCNKNDGNIDSEETINNTENPIDGTKADNIKNNDDNETINNTENLIDKVKVDNTENIRNSDIDDVIIDNKSDKNSNTTVKHHIKKLTHIEKLKFQGVISENIFMQSITTNYYNYENLEKCFVFADATTANKYCSYLKKKIDKFVLFNKLPHYQLNFTNFIEKYHVYTVNNFDSIAKKLLKSLALLHHNGFLHGDLKSGNVLINDSNNVCLTDFGAIKINNFDKYHLSCTISSRCPEDLEYEYGKNKYYSNSNGRSDIWSLGLIFAEMILGYNPVLKLYNKMQRAKFDLQTIEKEILAYYKSINYIDILQLVKINSIKNHLSVKHYLQITVIEDMLKIDPEKRLSSIEEVYEKLFGEKFDLNFKIEYDYQYEKFNVDNNFKTLFYLRKEHYKNIIVVCEQLNILYVCPLIIDILDRLFIKILDKIINNVIVLCVPESNVLFSAAVLLASGIINQSQPQYNNLLTLFKLKNDVLNVGNINNNLLEILKLMDFDIYRPFNIFYCKHLIENKKCDCTFKNYSADTFIIHDFKQKNNLMSLLINIIDDDIIGVSPEYYYTKLSIATL